MTETNTKTEARPTGGEKNAPAAASTVRQRLAVVIVNYGTADLVVDCLETLTGELDVSTDGVVVVDNGSPDDSVARLNEAIASRGLGDWVRLIDTGTNHGFAEGNNVALREIDADYVLLLNSDTLVRPGAVAALLARLEVEPSWGIVGPRLEWPDGEGQISCFRYLSPVSEFINAAGTGPITRALKRWDVPIGLYEGPGVVDWTTFACALIRREVIEEVGLLDRGYFLYFDDVDFCRRAGDAGWKVGHEPAAHVVHLRGKSGPVKEMTRQRKRRPRYYYESRAHYFARFYGRTGLWLANLMWWAGRLVSLARELVRNKKPHTCERQGLDNWIGGWDPLRRKGGSA